MNSLLTGKVASVTGIRSQCPRRHRVDKSRRAAHERERRLNTRPESTPWSQVTVGRRAASFHDSATMIIASADMIVAMTATAGTSGV